MTRPPIRLLTLLGALLWASPGLAQTDYQRAFAAGDYATAWEAAAPRAVEGDPEAQYLLGAMYFDGQGVEQDRCLATLWFDKAARRGHGRAQFRMGEAYAWGYGVYRRDDLARDWLILAGRSGISEARTAVPVVEERMRGRTLRTETEIVKSQRYIPPVEIEYFPMPHAILGSEKAAARNFFSPCRGLKATSLPLRWDRDKEGLPSLANGMKLFESGEYLAALDDLIFPAIYGRAEAADVITMLYMTGRVPEANKCLAAIWAQHGAREHPRMAAFLAQAFASGWGVRQNHETAYVWALHAYRKEPFFIDPAPFAARLTPQQRTVAEKRVDRIFGEPTPEVYPLPERLFAREKKANPFRRVGLASCSGD